MESRRDQPRDVVRPPQAQPRMSPHLNRRIRQGSPRRPVTRLQPTAFVRQAQTPPRCWLLRWKPVLRLDMCVSPRGKIWGSRTCLRRVRTSPHSAPRELFKCLPFLAWQRSVSVVRVPSGNGTIFAPRPGVPAAVWFHPFDGRRSLQLSLLGVTFQSPSLGGLRCAENAHAARRARRPSGCLSSWPVLGPVFSCALIAREHTRFRSESNAEPLCIA